MNEKHDSNLTRREFLQRAAILGLSASAITLLDGCGILPTPMLTPKKIPKIGLLIPLSPAATVDLVGAFRQGLGDLGYIEGKNIAIEYRYAESQNDRLPVFAAELIALNVDILISGGGGNTAIALKNATRTIPIVFLGFSDPVGSKLVASFAHPGGNVTGLTNSSNLVTGKRLELLKESLPGISRVAVSWLPSAPNNVINWKEAQEAASQLGVELLSLDYEKPEDFERVLATAMSRRPEALLSVDGVAATDARIPELATKNRLPSSFFVRAQVIAGGLMSYAANNLGYWYRAATYVDKILRGTKPADLPVEQPTKFDFVINMKTAKELGLTIPPAILAQATEVIQ